MSPDATSEKETKGNCCAFLTFLQQFPRRRRQRSDDMFRCVGEMIRRKRRFSPSIWIEKFEKFLPRTIPPHILENKTVNILVQDEDKDASPIVSFLFGELRSISRDDAWGEKFFSTRAPPFFNRGGRSLSRLHFALCPPDIVRHVLFFRRRFLWKQGAYVGKETPRGWRMFCNFSGLLVSRAVLVFLLKQSSHPLANWKDTFLSFSNCTDLSGFSFFSFFSMRQIPSISSYRSRSAVV